jgi:hypothetical protein
VLSFISTVLLTVYDCCLPANNHYRVLSNSVTLLLPLSLSSCLKYTDKNSALIPLDAKRSNLSPRRVSSLTSCSQDHSKFLLLLSRSGSLDSEGNHYQNMTQSTGPSFTCTASAPDRDQFPHRKLLSGVGVSDFPLSQTSVLVNPRSPNYR